MLKSDWFDRLHKLATELMESEDTDATIRKLRCDCRLAKAEAERLRKRHREARIEWGRLATKCDELQAELVSYTDSVNADAEIGRLVRGMRRGSHLSHPGLLEGWVAVDCAAKRQADNPAEALRAIQQVKEHKCE